MKKYKAISIKNRIFGSELLDKLDVLWVEECRVIAKFKGYGFIHEFKNDFNYMVKIEEY